MLGALVALFSCSSMVVIAHEVSYVIQTPSEVGTASKQAIKHFILRVDVLLAVAQRFNVRAILAISCLPLNSDRSSL